MRTLRVLAALTTLAASQPLHAQMSTPPTSPGVSLELARHRAATLSDVRYALALDVTGRDSARGSVRVEVARKAGAGDLVLDFRGPSLRRVRANGAAIRDFEWSQGHLRIPARHLRDGSNEISAEFTARIAAAGAPIIRADDPKDRGRWSRW